MSNNQAEGTPHATPSEWGSGANTEHQRANTSTSKGASSNEKNNTQKHSN